MSINLLLLLGLFQTNVIYSQCKNDIKKIEVSYQNCLDNGVGMLGCANKFYLQSDSLLNVVYWKLYNRLKVDEQNVLKKNQLKWIKLKEAEFKTNSKKIYDLDSSEAEYKMVILDKKAIFIIERVYYLVAYK